MKAPLKGAPEYSIPRSGAPKRASICLRGHSRVDNVDAKGSCKTCKTEQSAAAYRIKREVIFARNPFCERGHVRKDNLDKSGRCRTCKGDLTPNQMARNVVWKRIGIMNEDGSTFTFNDYNRAFQIQGGRCRGCQRHQTELERTLAADHDHETGMFRGLLCSECNFAIGKLNDDPDVLDRLANYLRGQK